MPTPLACELMQWKNFQLKCYVVYSMADQLMQNVYQIKMFRQHKMKNYLSFSVEY